MSQKIRLGDLVEITNGYAFKSSDYIDSGIRVIRITNVQKGSIVDNNPQYYPLSSQSTLNRYSISEGDILMSLTGNVGRVGRFPRELLPAYINQRVCRVKSRSSKLSNDYLFYVLNSDLFERDAIENSAGVAQLNLSTKWIEDYKIALPTLAEQQKIAAILDAADSLRQKDQQLVERYTALSQSLFLEMFGDPVTNPMGWMAVLLEDISDIASGVTKGRKLNSDEVVDLPYMRVANVQDGYLDLNEIKNIPGSNEDLKKYILKMGDVLLTEGGDPDKLGRGAVWNDEIKNCIHQNHIFRVRLTSKKHIPLYLSKLCGSE